MTRPPKGSRKTTARTSTTSTTEPAGPLSSPSRAAPAWSPVFFALGANLGDAERRLRWALEQLAELFGPLRAAPLYRSRPLAAMPQPWYLNTVARGWTDLPPEAVLALTKLLELRAGRRRAARGAPRPLDIDLLLYGSRLATDAELSLPHPGLRQRSFVLAPLADLAPRLRLPPDGTTPAELLAALPDDGGLQRLAAPSRDLAGPTELPR